MQAILGRHSPLYTTLPSRHPKNFLVPNNAALQDILHFTCLGGCRASKLLPLAQMRLSFLRAWAASVSISSNLRDPRASSLERSQAPPTVAGDLPGEPFGRFDEAGKIMADYPKWLCSRRLGIKLFAFRQDDIDNTISVNVPFPPIFPVAYIKLLTFEQPVVNISDGSATVSFPLTSRGVLSCNTVAEEYNGRIDMKVGLLPRGARRTSGKRR